MTAKEYHERYTKNCQKCSPWLMCKPHQNLWFKKVESTSVPFEDPKQGKVIAKVFKIVIDSDIFKNKGGQ